MLILNFCAYLYKADGSKWCCDGVKLRVVCHEHVLYARFTAV